jgi:hypothetical protein
MEATVLGGPKIGPKSVCNSTNYERFLCALLSILLLSVPSWVPVGYCTALQSLYIPFYAWCSAFINDVLTRNLTISIPATGLYSDENESNLYPNPY